MIAKIVGCVLGVGLLGGASVACAKCDYDQDESIRNAAFVSQDVRDLAGRDLPCASEPGGPGQAASAERARGEISAPVDNTPSATPRTLISEKNLCTKDNAGDLIEALMHKDFDVFNVVKDTIVACVPCDKVEEGPETASLVATRALRVKGAGARYMIDAAVLAAATEIGGRQCGGPAAPPDQAQRAFEKERLARIMDKGLTDDEYQRYIDEKTREFQPALPLDAVPDPGLYRQLYNAGIMGVVGSSLLDRTLDQRTDPGGYASTQ